MQTETYDFGSLCPVTRITTGIKRNKEQIPKETTPIVDLCKLTDFLDTTESSLSDDTCINALDTSNLNEIGIHLDTLEQYKYVKKSEKIKPIKKGRYKVLVKIDENGIGPSKIVFEPYTK